jgi:hypothetical protein
MVCERDGATTSNPIVSWADAYGSLFCLRAIGDREGQPSLDRIDAAHSEQDRVHAAGTSAAVWKIGDVYCKVKAYTAGMSDEADTIRFVRSKDHGVPLPDVIHPWVDESMNRTFLILKKTEGRTLEQSWPSLSAVQRSNIAAPIAKLCKSRFQQFI